MHEAHEFLRSLALVLCVAAVTTVIFQRLHQPVVFGYLMAGLIVGPHIPLPVVADEQTIRALSELGVILLMFGLGLEFSLRKLVQMAPTAGLIALIQSSTMVWIGYLVGQIFGWTQLESLYAGAVIAISSTTIILKAFMEQGARGKFTEIVFGILIIEDLIGIFLIAMLTTLSAGTGVSAESLGHIAVRLGIFLAVLIGGGLLIVPRLIRALVRLNRPETTLVATIGICFAAALIALASGYSVALGAFIAGSLVAESGEAKAIEHLVEPVRDMFAAVFFVAVGMLIDPALVVRHWPAVVALTLAVVVGKVVAVSMGSFLTGFGIRTSVQAGMSLAQIGEFSFIIAGVGFAAGATRDFLYPVAVAVSAITTLSTPWLIRASGPTAAYVDRKLPKRLQTFAALYGSWIEHLRSSSPEAGANSRIRRAIRLLLLDAVLLAVVVILAGREADRVAGVVASVTGISRAGARWLALAGAAAVAIPLAVGLARTARVLGLALALRALPASEEGAVDLAAAPRRALVITLQLAILALVGIPLLAVTQPFLPPLHGAVILTVILIAVLAALGVGFWRGTTNLHGHARAGAEMIVAALAQQMADGPQEGGDTGALEQVHRLLPGLGEPVPVRIDPGSRAVNRTLAQLNLRGVTGATVLAITRAGERVVLPVGREVLRAGDVLALAGTQEAVRAAAALLEGRPEDEDGRVAS